MALLLSAATLGAVYSWLGIGCIPRHEAIPCFEAKRGLDCDVVYGWEASVSLGDCS